MLLPFLKNITKDFLEKGVNCEKHEGKGGPGGGGGERRRDVSFIWRKGGAKLEMWHDPPLLGPSQLACLEELPRGLGWGDGVSKEVGGGSGAGR